MIICSAAPLHTLRYTCAPRHGLNAPCSSVLRAPVLVCTPVLRSMQHATLRLFHRHPEPPAYPHRDAMVISSRCRHAPGARATHRHLPPPRLYFARAMPVHRRSPSAGPRNRLTTAAVIAVSLPLAWSLLAERKHITLIVTLASSLTLVVIHVLALALVLILLLVLTLAIPVLVLVLIFAVALTLTCASALIVGVPALVLAATGVLVLEDPPRLDKLRKRGGTQSKQGGVCGRLTPDSFWVRTSSRVTPGRHAPQALDSSASSEALGCFFAVPPKKRTKMERRLSVSSSNSHTPLSRIHSNALSACPIERLVLLLDLFRLLSRRLPGPVLPFELDLSLPC